MRTPKEAFLQSGHSADFAKVASLESFEVACEAALLQLLFEMAPTTVPGSLTDPYVGLDANSQMFGARRVLAILLDLPTPIKPPTTEPAATLHYD